MRYSDRFYSTSLLVCLLSTACGIDNDPPETPEGHDCTDDIGFHGPWVSQKVFIEHSEPRTCPVHLAEQGEMLSTYGVIRDYEEEAEKNVFLIYEYEPASDPPLVDAEEPFYEDPYNIGFIANYALDWTASVNARHKDYLGWAVYYHSWSSMEDLGAHLFVTYTSDGCPQGNCIDMFPE